MGSWIANKFINAGYQICLYDNQEAVLTRAAKPLSAFKTFRTAPNLSEAIEKADLIIETIVEDVGIKSAFFKEIDSLISPECIITSNTSILSPQDFLETFRHKSQFCCFHFYTPNSAVDIAPIDETLPKIPDILKEVASAIGETPIVLKHHTPGYLFSAMAGALTDVALSLKADGIADVDTIDSCWRSITKMAMGPLAMLDLVGLDTSLAIRRHRLSQAPDNIHLKKSIQVLEDYVKAGKLGRKTGEGFFRYSPS